MDQDDKVTYRREQGVPGDSKLPGRPKRTSLKVKWGIQHTVAGASGAGLSWYILRNVDYKAWDTLIRQAFSALLVQQGPWPFIFVVMVITGFVFHHMAMNNTIKSKDDEIGRLIEHRDRIEEHMGISHPSSQRNIARKEEGQR